MKVKTSNAVAVADTLGASAYPHENTDGTLSLAQKKPCNREKKSQPREPIIPPVPIIETQLFKYTGTTIWNWIHGQLVILPVTAHDANGKPLAWYWTGTAQGRPWDSLSISRANISAPLRISGTYLYGSLAAYSIAITISPSQLYLSGTFDWGNNPSELVTLSI